MVAVLQETPACRYFVSQHCPCAPEQTKPEFDPDFPHRLFVIILFLLLIERAQDMVLSKEAAEIFYCGRASLFSLHPPKHTIVSFRQLPLAKSPQNY
jgi:hypothetical protein